MKKTILTILILFMLAGFAFAEAGPIYCPNVYSTTVLANTTVYTNRTELNKNDGYFSVQAIFTGTGVLKIDYQVSNDGTNWSTAVEIIASAVSGVVYPYPASGVNIFAKYQRLKLTETGTANPVVLTGLFRCAQ